MGVPEFTNADVAQLLKIQEEVRELLRKYREHTPAIVPAVALIRVAAVLLDAYPDADRKATVEDIIIPFLRGEQQQPSKRRGSIILPPGFRFN
jgi:hypothetical protein